MMTSTSIAMIASMAIFMVVSGLSVVLRIYLRKQKRVPLMADDYFVVAASAFSAALAVTNIVGVPVGGFGVPFLSLSPEKAIKFLKILFILQFWYIIAVALVKFSILYLYGRVFGLGGKYPISVYVLLGITTAWLISFLFATFFQVWPLSCNWVACIPTTNYPLMYVLSSVTDIIIDISILCLPIFFIRKMQMSGNVKIGVVAIFGLGIFCVISSVTRLAYTVLFFKTDIEGDYAVNFDTAVVNIIMWSGIEACASTVCANLPCFRALLGQARSVEAIVASLRTFISIKHYSQSQPSFVIGVSKSGSVGGPYTSTENIVERGVGGGGSGSRSSTEGSGGVGVELGEVCRLSEE